jgi:Domain of unknown function (DUF4837)
MRFHRFAIVIGTMAILFVLTGGCAQESRDTLFSAVGSYGDIALMTSSPQISGSLSEFLEIVNPAETFVIKKEDTYRIHSYSDKDWKLGRNYRNILFVIRWGDGGPLEKEVKHLLSEETLTRLTTGQGGMVPVRNPYFKNQLAFVIIASQRSNLRRVLKSQAPIVARTLGENIIERMIQDNQRNGLTPGLDKKYLRDYGFSLEVPRYYKENQVRPDGFPGLELLQSTPVTRGISISWEGTENPAIRITDRDFLLGMRERLGEALHDETLSAGSLEWSTETVAGREVTKLSGAWSSADVGVGGPFRSYFFPDAARERIVCVDLLVYAPNKEKMDYFRSLRAVLETFALAEPGGS